MIYYNGGVCYILLKEGKYTVKISHVVPTNPQIAEELLLMNIAKAHEETNKDREKMSIRNISINIW